MSVECDALMDEVMTPNPIFVGMDTSVNEAKNIMNRIGVRHLPVVNKGNVESVVCERDIDHLSRLHDQYQHEGDWLMKDIGTKHVHLADVNDPLGKVLCAMTKQKIDAVVLLREGEIAGIFTEADACRVLAKHLGYCFEEY